MDQIDKALKKLAPQERIQLAALLERIRQRKFAGLDLKKLVGSSLVYRVRKGDLRIIFTYQGKEIRVLALERRTTNTYRKR